MVIHPSNATQSNSSNKSEPPSLSTIEKVLLIVLLSIPLTLIGFLASMLVLTYNDNLVTSNISNIIEQSLLDDENSFLNVTSPHKKALVTAIIDNSTITVAETSSMSNKVVEICVPSFSAALEKNFPALFTYSNVGYVTSRLNSSSEQEYIDAIYSGVLPEFVSPTVFYRVTVAVSLKRNSNHEWEIENLSEIENHFLGNILSYQNNDVNFLTLKDIIFPEGAGVQTSSVEATALFQDVSPASSYSSPETLVPIGDTAKFSGIIDDSMAKINIDLILSDVQTNTDNTITANFKVSTAEPNTETTIPSNLFGIYSNGVFQNGIAQDHISVTSEPSSFQISFESATDFIVFNPDASPIYFATKTE